MMARLDVKKLWVICLGISLQLILPGCSGLPAPLPAPAIWPPNGELKPNNYIPPTTTPLPKLEFRYENKEFCRNITKPNCETIVKTRNITRCVPIDIGPESAPCKPGKTIHYREKCEVEYNIKCTPLFNTKSREKCEDSYQAKCEELTRVEYKSECTPPVYAKDCHKNKCKQVKPVCRQVPVKRKILSCSRQPKRICTQVMLPDLHKCGAPKQKCIMVPIEVDNKCVVEVQKPKEKCTTEKEEYKDEVCSNIKTQICEERKVKIPIIKPLGTTIPPQPFTTNKSRKTPLVTAIIPSYYSSTQSPDESSVKSSTVQSIITDTQLKNDIKDIEIGDEDIDQYYTKFQV